MKVLMCPFTDPGYLYPATSVALELQRRGHSVTLLTDGPAAAAGAAGIGLRPAAALPVPDLFRVHRWFQAGADQYRWVRDAVRAARPDVLVTSVLCLGPLLAAAALGLPVVVIGLACHLWPYLPGGAVAEDSAQRAWRLRECLDPYHRAREQAGLAAHQVPEDERALLGTVFLLRGHPGLETPGSLLPEQVRHVGPCWWEPPADPAVLEPLRASIERTGKPLVYVHLARAFHEEGLWPWIESAFSSGDFQALVELGRSRPSQASAPDVLTVRLPWLGPLLERADLVVSSGTSAPVLAALLHGRPLLVSPDGGEQKVLAAACRNAGVAAALSRTTGAASLHAVARDRALHARAGQLADALRQTKSESLAADAVEDACR
ncbi:glycosyltransferase [Streptomyces sp. NPDC006739]|uniref:glycosyltransferase n=1 Tax=Streptomyces sp. NPDC006739 TaxID=3364763 RepID=UPI003696EB8F